MSAQTQTAGGVLPIPAAVLQKPTTSNGPSNKATAPRLKLVLRRLAPGLTQAEFENALGDAWKLKGGKVDWLVYKPGKISKDLSKPSRPARAYIHLTSQEHLQPLSEKVRDTPFQDGKTSFNDACLIGPPSLEFAPLPKVPLGKKRNDQRQGTIDQDADFQAFLQSLTDPITKPAPHESENAALPKEMTTTPLIEAIRARKAAKEQAAKDKAAKAKEGGKSGKEDKAAEKSKGDRAGKGSAKDAHPEKGKKQSKVDKAAKEAVKVLNTQAAAAAGNSKAKDSTADGAATSTSTVPAPERKRERGNASIAKQMLARDLGLGPAGGRRGRRDQGAVTTEVNAKSSEPPTGPKASAAPTPLPAGAPAASSGPEQSTTKRDNKPTRAERRAHKTAQADQSKAAGQSSAAPTILKKEPPSGPAAAATSSSPPTGPAASRTTTTTAPPTGPRSSSVSTTAPSSTSSAAATASPSTNRHAFLKHANPSQGITEALLQDALSAFGPVEAVEIDKRKGFAYATFATPDALRAAMKGSPVKVAEGAVVVLEKREGGTGGRGQQGAGGARGMSPAVRGGGRGGGARGGGSAARGGRGGAAAGGSGAPSTGKTTATATSAPAAPAASSQTSNTT